MKDVLVDPAGTVTVPGTVTVLRLELSVNVRPPVGAGLGRVMVPVLVLPPMTSNGAIVSAKVAGASTVRVVETVPPLRVALMFAVVVVVTAEVDTRKVAEVAPAATVTLAGTAAEVLEDARLTDVPPVGAMPVSEIVPLEEVPPNTEVGFTLIAARPGALMVSAAVLVTAPLVAVTVTDLEALTADVPTVKLAAVAPTGIVMLA